MTKLILSSLCLLGLAASAIAGDYIVVNQSVRAGGTVANQSIVVTPYGTQIRQSVSYYGRPAAVYQAASVYQQRSYYGTRTVVSATTVVKRR